MVGHSRSNAPGVSSSINCGRPASKGSASMAIRPRLRPPAGWSSTSAARRKSISHTSVRSHIGSVQMRCSWIQRRSGISRLSKAPTANVTALSSPSWIARSRRLDRGCSARGCSDRELDDLRTISRSGKQVIAEMEQRERARTGIASLKVRFNRVFGYYIEVSKSNLHAVPPDYHRKQTIAGGERFITPALKEYEEKVLGADERILERELEIFERLRTTVAGESPRIQATARALAALDVLAAFAETAAVNNYIKPHVHDGDELSVADGRHPVVERRSSAAGSAFVPNDVTLNGTACQLVLLTA